MDIHNFFDKINGKWRGTYRLWLDPAKDSEDSDATASIRFIANKKYMLFTYSWQHEGKDQEGIFLLGGDRRMVSATWVDSFHSAPQPTVCDGALTEDGDKIILNGYYFWAQEKWGWRTEIFLRHTGALVMEAYNISPELREDIAVRCEMKRVSK